MSTRGRRDLFYVMGIDPLSKFWYYWLWVYTRLNYYIINMPNLDSTGPLGQGPMTGRKLGFLPRSRGRRQGGSGECTCPKCGYKEPHTRGVPCTQKMCPKCGTPMKGIFCL